MSLVSEFIMESGISHEDLCRVFQVGPASLRSWIDRGGFTRYSYQYTLAQKCAEVFDLLETDNQRRYFISRFKHDEVYVRTMIEVLYLILSQENSLMDRVHGSIGELIERRVYGIPVIHSGCPHGHLECIHLKENAQ